MIKYTFSKILVAYYSLHFKIIIITMQITWKDKYISNNFFTKSIGNFYNLLGLRNYFLKNKPST